DHIHLATGHQMAGGDVGDEPVRYPGLSELPGRQAGALEVRPRLVDEDLEVAALVERRLDDPAGRPELAAREWPVIAVGQDPEGPVLRARQELEAVGRQAAVVLRRL